MVLSLFKPQNSVSPKLHIEYLYLISFNKQNKFGNYVFLGYRKYTKRLYFWPIISQNWLLYLMKIY